MMGDETMIEMYVTGIALDVRSGIPLVILNDKEHKFTLPIWIGHAEAQAIARALEGIETERPMTHDLIVDMIDSMDCEIDSIEINTFENSTFFASINMIDEEDEIISVDARPSDSIALALRIECPILVSETILEEEIKQAASEPSHHEKKEFAEFQEFLKGVKASDFTLKGKDD